MGDSVSNICLRQLFCIHCWCYYKFREQGRREIAWAVKDVAVLVGFSCHLPYKEHKKGNSKLKTQHNPLDPTGATP